MMDVYVSDHCILVELIVCWIKVGEPLHFYGDAFIIRAISTHLASIICIAVGPYKLKIILKLSLRLILFLFNLSEHRLEVHRLSDDYKHIRST